MRLHNIYRLLILLLVSLATFSCSEDRQAQENDDFKLSIRLAEDPERLNPMILIKSVPRQVMQYIFLPLADYDPVNLELSPILIDKLPEGQVREDAITFNFRFKDDALWSDGEIINADDYVSTIKTALVSGVDATKWRNYLKYIQNITIDPDDRKSFSVTIDEEVNLLALELASTVQLYPKHIYDPQNVLDNYTIDQLREDDFYDQELEKDSSLYHFAEQFNSASYSRDIVVGAGPYTLTSWKTNQYLILDKQKDYWGNNYPQNAFLQAHASQMEFLIIKDETAALSMMKGGELDILPNLSANGYKSVLEDEAFGESLYGLTPQIMRYYYLLLNNRSEGLDSKIVRRALAHLTHVEEMIKTLENGTATRTIGHFHPSKSYYHKELAPIEFNIDKAKELLSSDGWSDDDGDGILEKNESGKKIKLEFDIYITGSALGKNVALIFQQDAAKAGVKINIIEKANRAIINEHIRPRKFDIYASAMTLSAAVDNPIQRWHSNLVGINKMNHTGFSNERADELMELISAEKDAEKRREYYLEFQEILYEEQPAIFLYSPTEKIIVNNRIELSASPKRPGYFANTASLR